MFCLGEKKMRKKRKSYLLSGSKYMSLLNFGFKFDDWGIIPGLPGIQAFWLLRRTYPGEQESQVGATLGLFSCLSCEQTKEFFNHPGNYIPELRWGWPAGGHTQDKSNLEQRKFPWERGKTEQNTKCSLYLLFRIRYKTIKLTVSVQHSGPAVRQTWV